MTKRDDKDTRFYIDLDLRSGSIVGWNYDNRFKLAQVLPVPLHRVFLTKGQYNKLEQKSLEVTGRPRRTKPGDKSSG